MRLFKKAGEVRPEDYQAALFLASAYERLNSPEKTGAARRAVTFAEKHLQLNPDDARALYLGAGALTTLGEFERATEWGKRALAIDPDDPRVHYNIACLYSVTGKTEQALEHFEIPHRILGARNHVKDGNRYCSVPGHTPDLPPGGRGLPALWLP